MAGHLQLREMRLLPALLLTAGCALALTACGGSNKSGTAAANHASALVFANCMRSHGVPNFPDPGGGGGGFSFQSGSGVNPQSPAFQTAQKDCGKFGPGGPGPGRATEQQKVAMLGLSQCMRRHGLTNFPDPVATPPRFGDTRGLGIAFGRPGSFIVIPGSIVQSPAFQQDARACGFPGARGGHTAPAPG